MSDEQMGKEPDYRELVERNKMLNDIALSAVALKLMIENGFTPQLHALSRDLAAYQRRFKSALPVNLARNKEAREHSPDLTNDQNHVLLELLNAVEAVENNAGAGRPAGWTRIVAAKDEVDRMFFVRLDEDAAS